MLTETKNADATTSCYHVAITKNIISAITHRTRANKASIKSPTKVISLLRSAVSFELVFLSLENFEYLISYSVTQVMHQRQT